MSSNESASGGGVASASEPRTKKQRTDAEFQPDGPVEDEATAREKMEEVGLDPDDVKKQCQLTGEAADDIGVFDGTMSPMSYFGRLGDLKMCRYLLSKGASTTEASEYHYNGIRCWWFPMYAAAIGGKLEVCKWLYKHGAQGDIKKTNSGNFSPFSCSLRPIFEMNHIATCQWFILMGALSEDGSGVVSPALVRQDMVPQLNAEDVWVDERSKLLQWAQESVQPHDRFMVFLMGTTPTPAFSQEALRKLLLACTHSGDAVEMVMSNTPEEQYELLYKKITECRTPLRCLAGKIGLLEQIADFVGVVRGRDLLILRSLVGTLSEYLEEVPERGSIEGQASSSDEEGTDDED